MKHMFKGNVHHGASGCKPTKYKKGDECPPELVKQMDALGVIEPVPEAVKVTQPEAPKGK